jgi:hypothetical protein
MRLLRQQPSKPLARAGGFTLPRRPLFRGLAVALVALSLASRPAHSGDPWEGWPEASAFVQLNRLTRLYFDAAYARGKESASHTLDLAGYVDLSIKPIARPKLYQEDWARGRYLWARVGYDYVLKGEDGAKAPSEHRGIVSAYAKAPAPGEVWFEGRARADLRWINGEYSTRYRLRLEANREFVVGGHPILPYFNAEAMYDTRYDDWARTLYLLGPEVTVSPGFRFELYLARQVDHRPRESVLNALGLMGKWYF